MGIKGSETNYPHRVFSVVSLCDICSPDYDPTQYKHMKDGNEK